MISEAYHRSGSRGSKVTPESRARDPIAGPVRSVEGLADPGFLVFLGFLNGIEVTLLAAADETLRIALELVPAVPDGLRFIGGDGMVESGFRDMAEQPGELINNFAGGGEDVDPVPGRAVGIVHEVAITFLAKPLHDAGVPGQTDDFEEAVEGITAPATGIRLLLGPLVYEGQGHPQFGRNRLRACVIKGLLEDFVRFHNCILGDRGEHENYSAWGKRRQIA